MDKVDQFTSLFRSAVKPVYRYAPISIKSACLVTDEGPEQSAALQAKLMEWLDTLDADVNWSTLCAQDYRSSPDLMDILADRDPDLIITYRNLHSPTGRSSFTLGSYLDVMTQAVRSPVLVIPHPDDPPVAPMSQDSLHHVMVLSDHLTDDGLLINSALPFVRNGGLLHLAHAEDGRTFGRYCDLMSRIPNIETQEAGELILEQLLKEPRDYIATASEALKETNRGVRIRESVFLSEHLMDYKELIEEHKVHLLVLHTKDEDQLAMHGGAYPLAVELRHIPLLLI